ncbi:CopG family transcriptional regulator [Arcticibacterium luteifluviistationis]|uniref:CopG family transcriptional regulator n=1 Tax=Arcticibacterium luteifluviistationis TaxID=1784714 RepID=A0A2Z4G829_9BACT|nr:CopG family transcriptional regulator [Arcticibacterium luteifluviistationis]AWV97255.1 CopG family transcriptional regulator [Arcticibacterium luteifluviistationis]
MSDRINARLSKPLADHVNSMVGSDALYETPSEYIRSLIRRDMEGELSQVYSSIMEGFTDIKESRTIKSSGSWKKDKELFKQKQFQNWE